MRRGLTPLRRLFTWDYAAFVTSCPRLRPQRSFCRRNLSSLPQRMLEPDAERCCGGDWLHSGGFLLRIMPPSWHPVPACVRNGILQAGRSSVQQRCCSRRAVLLCCNVIRIGRGIRCRYGRCRRAILYRHDDCAASIRKSGPEIKNRCTQEGVNGEKLASIPKFGLEIKNRCTQKDVFGEKLTSILKSGLEIKNRCTQ